MTRAAAVVVGPPVGTAVRALRDTVRGTVLARGSVSARSLDGSGSVEVTFEDGHVSRFSGRGINDYVLWGDR